MMSIPEHLTEQTKEFAETMTDAITVMKEARDILDKLERNTYAPAEAREHIARSQQALKISRHEAATALGLIITRG